MAREAPGMGGESSTVTLLNDNITSNCFLNIHILPTALVKEAFFVVCDWLLDG